MWITRVASVRYDVARPQELAAPHIVRTVTPYSVACNVVLVILVVNPSVPLTA
ncbi:MAG: hypothetical protein KatS3mg056_0257 [Chloroflexus sp.]|nr:MAG: hypothetical protein KatS3mg056_0257 [Chloroflexus sp.]